MLSDKMQQALNDQIQAELYSSYLYLSMSAWFESINLPGHARWLQVQAQEELMHAMKFYGHVHERLGRVTLQAIGEPPTEFQSPLAAFEAAFGHEQMITGRINALVDLAIEEHDHAGRTLLQWFVDEQIEEEASADAVVQKLKVIGDMPGLMFQFDEVMGQRVAGGASAAAGEGG
jgi:ferritin